MGEMTFDRMVGQMTPAIYESLKQAVQLRKWPDGRRLTPEQTELCLEAVIKYEAEHKVPEQQRVGYIGAANCKSQDAGSQDGDSIKWVN
ncbi:YeaC family protein [Halomonas sp. WWR20]